MGQHLGGFENRLTEIDDEPQCEVQSFFYSGGWGARVRIEHPIGRLEVGSDVCFNCCLRKSMTVMGLRSFFYVRFQIGNTITLQLDSGTEWAHANLSSLQGRGSLQG